MATDVGGMPNGNYAPHQGYGGIDQNNYSYNTNAASTQSAAQQPPASSTPSNAQTQQQDISKDEVGWYFVEQYYTTLSRSPEKLYLFYNKRSQFVSGQETDKVAVCVGQRAINDKIKDLDFVDCKVRVTNVDSQASDSNIVIQVIGELSNKGQPHRKFSQTFVLATQTNGYFVLNDIFRYLIDEEEDPETEAVTVPAEDVQQVPGTESGYQEPPPTEAEPKTLPSTTDATVVEQAAKEVDKTIEKKLSNHQEAEDAPVAAVNGDSAEEPAEVEEETLPALAEPEPETAASAVEEERPITSDSNVQPEKPKDPEPTPVASPPKPVAAQPAAPSKPAAPAVPMSWASRAAAANRVATPATPSTPASTSTNASKPNAAAAKTATPPAAAPTSNPSAPTQTAPSGPAAQRQEAAGSDSQDEWTAVGPSHNRQQSKQTNVQQDSGPQFRGYIKNVHESVDYDELKSKLEQFGELLYLDIARAKNCAFVDFKTAEGYKAATQAPVDIGDEKLLVEERRIRPGQTPYVPRGQFQGGRGGRGGAGGQGAPRGNFQGNRGGNNAPRGGRGGFGPQRGGRGGAQA